MNIDSKLQMVENIYDNWIQNNHKQVNISDPNKIIEKELKYKYNLTTAYVGGGRCIMHSMSDALLLDAIKIKLLKIMVGQNITKLTGNEYISLSVIQEEFEKVKYKAISEGLLEKDGSFDIEVGKQYLLTGISSKIPIQVNADDHSLHIGGDVNQSPIMANTQNSNQIVTFTNDQLDKICFEIVELKNQINELKNISKIEQKGIWASFSNLLKSIFGKVLPETISNLLD